MCVYNATYLTEINSGTILWKPMSPTWAGSGGTRYIGLYGQALPERGTFSDFRFMKE